MKALVLKGKVVELAEQSFEVHEDFEWVDATDDAEVGGSWDGSSFGPADARTPEEKAAHELKLVRRERNVWLKQTDWTQYPDAPLSPEKKAEFATYRQALRDFPETYQTLADAEGNWPVMPTVE